MGCWLAVEEVVNGITKFLDARAKLLLDAGEGLIALNGLRWEQKIHTASDFAGTWITESTWLTLDGAMAKSDLAHNIFISPVLDVLAHFWFSDVHNRELEVA